MKELYLKLTKGNKQIIQQILHIYIFILNISVYIETGRTDMQRFSAVHDEVCYSPNHLFLRNVNECLHHLHLHHTEACDPFISECLVCLWRYTVLRCMVSELVLVLWCVSGFFSGCSERNVTSFMCVTDSSTHQRFTVSMSCH